VWSAVHFVHSIIGLSMGSAGTIDPSSISVHIGDSLTIIRDPLEGLTEVIPADEFNSRLSLFTQNGNIYTADIIENIREAPTRESLISLGRLLRDDQIVNGERYDEALLDLALLVEPDIRVRIIWSRFRHFNETALSLGACMRRIRASDFDIYLRILNMVALVGDAPLRHLLHGIISIASVIDSSEHQLTLAEPTTALVSQIRELILMTVLSRDIYGLRNFVALTRNLKDIHDNLPDVWNKTIVPLIPNLSEFVAHCIDDEEESLTPVFEFLETIHTIAERGRLTGWAQSDPSIQTLTHRNLIEWVGTAIHIDPSQNLADSFARWAPVDFLNSQGIGDTIDSIRSRDIDVYDFLLQATHPNVRAWEDDEIVLSIVEFNEKLSTISSPSDFIIPNVYDTLDTDPDMLAIAYVRTAIFWGILHGHFEFKDLVFLALFRKSFMERICAQVGPEFQDLFDDILLASGEYARLFLVEEFLPVNPIMSLMTHFNQLVVSIHDPTAVASQIELLYTSIRGYIEDCGIHLGPVALSPHHRRHGLGPEILPFGISNMYGNFLRDLSLPVFEVSPRKELVAISRHDIARIEFVPFTVGRFLRLVLPDNASVVHDLNNEESVGLVSSSLRLYPTERVAIDFDDERVIFWFPSYRLPRELFLAPEEFIVTGFTDPVFEYERGFVIVVITKSLRDGSFTGSTLQISAYGSSYVVDSFLLPNEFTRIELVENAIFVDGIFYCETFSGSRRANRFVLEDKRSKEETFLSRFSVTGNEIIFDGTFFVDLDEPITNPLKLLVDDKYAVLVVKTESSTVLVDIGAKWSPQTTGFAA